jgi:hypothetical protein
MQVRCYEWGKREGKEKKRDFYGLRVNINHNILGCSLLFPLCQSMQFLHFNTFTQEFSKGKQMLLLSSQ